MRYPNVKPKQGEQEDINQRRYPDDNIEVAGEPRREQEAQDEYDDPSENLGNDPQRRNEDVWTQEGGK